MGRGGRVLVALAVAGAAFGIATVVQAAIPGSNGVISGCYQFSAPNTSKGVLRVIDAESGEGCRFNERSISWNALGPTGLGNVYQASAEVDNVSAGGTVASVDVPAGNYHVVATGWAAGLTAGLKDIRCYIDQPNADQDDTFISVGQDTVDIGGQSSFALNGNVVRDTDGTISVGCLDNSTDDTILEGASITATTARTLNGTVIALKPHSTAKASARPGH